MSFSASCSVWPGTCSAGARPKTTPVRTAASRQKPSTVTSVRTLPRSGMLSDSMRASRWVPPAASITPSTAPQQDSVTPSVSIWRISRRRPAPSAVRMAISFCRVAVRASSRLERLAQTISITTPTAHASTSRAGRIRPLTCSASGLIRPSKSLRSGCAWVICCASIFSSAWALPIGDAGLQAADDRHGVSPAVGLVAQGKGKIQIEMAAGREDRGEIERSRQARRPRSPARR